MNPVSIILDFIVNNPDYRGIIVPQRNTGIDKVAIDYNAWKEAFDYCEEEIPYSKEVQ